MNHSAGTVDPSRPWIRDPRDAPSQMNCVQTLFNPLGKTSKLHFSRAWTMMFFGRLLLYIVPSWIIGIAGVAGVKTDGANTPVDLLLFTVPALLLPFAIYTLVTEYTSFVAHIRRLTEAGRSAFFGVIVLIPLMLGLLVYALGTQMGAMQYRMMHSPPKVESVEAKTETASEDETTGEEDDTSAGGDSPPAGAAAGQGGRRSPQMQQMMGMSERELAVATGMGMAFPVWGLASFFVMLWTLLYVARLPNGGQGRIRTGSDLTPEEIERGA